MNAKRLMWETKKLQLKKTCKKKEQNIKNSFWHKAVFRLTQKQLGSMSLTLRQNFMSPRDPRSPRQNLAYAPTLPTPPTLFSRLLIFAKVFSAHS